MAATAAAAAARQGAPWSHALRSTITAWRLYLVQRSLPAALALALLHLTVMSLGLLMTAYLNWHGMDEATLSVARGFGAASGIAATFAFPALHTRAGEAHRTCVDMRTQCGMPSRDHHAPNCTL